MEKYKVVLDNIEFTIQRDADGFFIMPEILKNYEGFSVNLKPACEFFTLARKPLSEKTVAKNVLRWGTGGINIDGCRIPYSAENPPIPQLATGKTEINGTKTMFDGNSMNKSTTKATIGGNLEGRFPSNVIHDGSDEVIEAFPDAKGQQGDLKNHKKDSQSQNGIYGKFGPKKDAIKRNETNKSASRFFKECRFTQEDKLWQDQNQNQLNVNIVEKLSYQQERGEKDLKRFKFCAKANKKDRTNDGTVDNNHPTVKPTPLMTYLCRLITPVGGIVLDPFMGSGSTGKGALLEGFSFVGIEREEEYFTIAKQRILNELEKRE